MHRQRDHASFGGTRRTNFCPTYTTRERRVIPQKSARRARGLNSGFARTRVSRNECARLRVALNSGVGYSSKVKAMWLRGSTRRMSPRSRVGSRQPAAGRGRSTHQPGRTTHQVRSQRSGTRDRREQAAGERSSRGQLVTDDARTGLGTESPADAILCSRNPAAPHCVFAHEALVACRDPPGCLMRSRAMRDRCPAESSMADGDG